ncbi:MAG: 5'/3'-nucleotidase SurE [Planctomycetaceae bacterium]|jgi:5'-nucleotidase
MSASRLLLTNDDGVDAAGLAALREVARAVSSVPPITVAPDECHSGAGHRVTTLKPLRVERRDPHVFSTSGTPADCVRLALGVVVPEVDWVLAGINHGGNLGADVFMSGTVAAVREGVLHGKPGISTSHYHRKGVDPLDWQRAARWLTPIVRDLMSRPWTPGTFWNVNLPHIPAGAPDPQIVACELDPSPLQLRFRPEGDDYHYLGDYHQRPRVAGSDVDLCFQGNITVSLVRLY